jgi:predicted nucleic acid-binding protein
MLMDTNVAIGLANGQSAVADRVAALARAPFLSIISRVELESGVYADPDEAEVHRARVDTILEIVEELAFTGDEVAAYSRIVRDCGFSRRLVIDRMIAATAMTHDLTLITMNGADFRSIPGLKLEIWRNPPE